MEWVAQVSLLRPGISSSRTPRSQKRDLGHPSLLVERCLFLLVANVDCDPREDETKFCSVFLTTASQSGQVPHVPDFLLGTVSSPTFMRLSSEKAAYAAVGWIRVQEIRVFAPAYVGRI